jgi:pseudouridine synthase
VKGRVYPVGRLDWASEGLILMTNDGALANALMKASSNVPKVYVVKVAGQPDEPSSTSFAAEFPSLKKADAACARLRQKFG